MPFIVKLMFYCALFVMMIMMAAIHNWFAFAGFLIAWLLGTALSVTHITNNFH